MIEAEVVADSVARDAPRLVTMRLRYPRFIHAEFMTHRVFSRNASSSRAIPVDRMIADMVRDPAMPVHWGGKKRGMQAAAELPKAEIESCRMEWLAAMRDAIAHAEKLRDLGLHKQIANRILEPWVHMNTLVTATEWQNFWELRCHEDAQPEIKALADAMRAAMDASLPVQLNPGEWHLPMVPCETQQEHGTDVALKLSVARCARVSYLTHGGEAPTVEADLRLYGKLVGARPLHASPAEHQATPDVFLDDAWGGGWLDPGQHGNFVGWRQYRKKLEQEVV
jgi:hypothetical protein